MSNAPSAPRSVEIEDAEFGQGDFSLECFSLRLDPGERVWLAGPNGCGKTTVLLALAGLIPVAAGEIRWGDQLLSRPGETVEPRLRGCGILLQDLGLWPHVTLREQCLLMSPQAAPRLDRWAPLLDVEKLLDGRPSSLSGGQAQRAALLRTLCGDVSWLLLDEPFSAQAEAGAERMNELLTKLQGEGVGVLVASHQEVPEARTVKLL